MQIPSTEEIRARRIAGFERHIEELGKLLNFSGNPDFRTRIKRKIREAKMQKLELQGKVVSK